MKTVGVDIGGTFTDCLVLDETGAVQQFKAHSTPKNPTAGFLDAVGKAAAAYDQDLSTFLGDVDVLVHGTTLATNTLINGTGAKTAMLTTRNFRDILEIRRGIRDVRVSMYDLFHPPYKPLVRRKNRYGITERMLYSGEEMTPLAEEDVVATVEELKKEGMESIAICFLHSYANPGHEKKAAAMVNELMDGVYVIPSHEVLPVWQEFERFSTTVVDAYVGPTVSRYLSALEQELREAGFAGGRLLIMLANGLTQTVKESAKKAVFLIGSGPAAAPSAGTFMAEKLGDENIITMDMGGTSLDVCLIQRRQIPTTTESWVHDHRVAIKTVDVHSVGAGGGSVAWVDPLGLLRVGPRSAGADPGPCCYGLGGEEATVTDAALVLGYIPADYFLGGEVALDIEKARAAVAKIGQAIEMDTMGAAEAIIKTVNANMANAIIEVSTKQGIDVRDFTLTAGGGAGPVCAAFIADQLEIPKIVVPQSAAVFSASGMLSMNLGRDFARSHISRLNMVDPAQVNQAFLDMETEAAGFFDDMDIPEKQRKLIRSVEMRYIKQFHEVEFEIPLEEITAEALQTVNELFHKRHRELYSFDMQSRPVELLNLRLKAFAPGKGFQPPKIKAGSEDPSAALKRKRVCRFDGKDSEVPIYDGARLEANNVLKGPCIVEESVTTVVVPPNYRATVDEIKNYIITRN